MNTMLCIVLNREFRAFCVSQLDFVGRVPSYLDFKNENPSFPVHFANDVRVYHLCSLQEAIFEHW